MKISVIVMSMLTFFITGCALAPQEVTLVPNVHVIDSNTGKDLKVTVRIKDERSSETLGYRGAVAAKGAKGAAVTTTQNMGELVRSEILKGLKKKGFDITEYGTKHEREFIVEIRHLECYLSMGLLTGSIHVKGALKVIAKNRGIEYEEMYRIENKNGAGMGSVAKKRGPLISEGLSNLLEKMFSDKRLFRFLSDQSPITKTEIGP